MDFKEIHWWNIKEECKIRLKVKHYDEDGKKSLKALIKTLEDKIEKAEDSGDYDSCSTKKNEQEADKLNKWLEDGKRYEWVFVVKRILLFYLQSPFRSPFNLLTKTWTPILIKIVGAWQEVINKYNS